MEGFTSPVPWENPLTESKQPVLISAGKRQLPFSPCREDSSQQLGSQPGLHIWMKRGHLSFPRIPCLCTAALTGLKSASSKGGTEYLKLLKKQRQRGGKKDWNQNSIFGVFCSTVKQRALGATVLTHGSCFGQGIDTVKSWELFKMPVSIIAVL